MRTERTAHDTSQKPGPSRDAGMPWASLIVLGAVSFMMVTAEMLPTAMLPQLSKGLGVSEAEVGLLVSIWAAVVVVASFPLVRFTSRWNRRSVIIAALVLLTISSALSASAPDYGWMIVARLLGALAVGLLWATINALTADIVPDARLASAVAVVLGGATMGTVVGTAGASFVGVATDWHVPFWILSALALVGAALVRLVVAMPVTVPATTSKSSAHAISRRGLRRKLSDPMLVITALVALMLIGHYGAFTFITRLTELSATILPGGTATVLLVFGIASTVGIAIAGKSGTRTATWLLASSVATAVAVLALLLVDAHPLVGIAVLILWGAVSGAMPALAQTMILRLAGPNRRALAGALIPVLFNVGVAAGAGLASAIVAGPGITALPLISGIVIVAGVVGQLTLARASSRQAT